MNLSPDYTLLIQIATFLVLWACLKRLVFDPMLHVLNARHQRTAGTREAAASMLAGVQAASARHAEAVHSARQDIAQQSEASRKSAQEEYERALAAARSEAATEQSRQRAALQEQLDGARRALAAEAETVALEMLDRVAGGARS